MADRNRAARPGRNDLCPCDSGKKFKKCHFGRAPHGTAPSNIDPSFLQRRGEAARIQRERQQGFGNQNPADPVAYTMQVEQHLALVKAARQLEGLAVARP